MRVESHAIADFTVVINRHIGIEQAVAAHLRVFLDNGVGINLRAIANGSAFTDIYERTDVAILANCCRWINASRRVNARTLGNLALIKSQQTRNGLVSIWHTNQRGAYRLRGGKVLVDKHNR